MKSTKIVMNDYFNVLERVKKRIVEAQYNVMTAANVEKNVLYWNIGRVIVKYSQWGGKFVENLSKDLKMEFQEWGDILPGI